MRVFLLFFQLFLVSILYSQESIVAIHSSVGKEIDKIEKNRYLLFPEIEDSVFISSTIFKDDSLLFARIVFANDSISTQALTNTEVDNMALCISKLDDYYSYELSKDSLLMVKMDSIMNLGNQSFQSVENFNKLQNSSCFKKDLKKIRNNRSYNTKLNDNIEQMEDRLNNNRNSSLNQSLYNKRPPIKITPPTPNITPSQIF